VCWKHESDSKCLTTLVVVSSALLRWFSISVWNRRTYGGLIVVEKGWLWIPGSPLFVEFVAKCWLMPARLCMSYSLGGDWSNRKFLTNFASRGTDFSKMFLRRLNDLRASPFLLLCELRYRAEKVAFESFWSRIISFLTEGESAAIWAVCKRRFIRRSSAASWSLTIIIIHDGRMHRNIFLRRITARAWTKTIRLWMRWYFFPESFPGVCSLRLA